MGRVREFIRYHRYAFIITLLLLFVVLMTTLLSLIEEQLESLETASIFSSVSLFPFLALLPFPLGIAIIVNFVHIVRNRLRNRAGSRIRIQLTLFFVVITLVSAAPQAYLSVNLVRIMLNTWYSSNANTALSRGLDLALNYYTDRIELLKAVVNNEGIYEDWPRNRQQATDFFEKYPAIDAIQVFNKNVTLYYGDERFKQNYQAIDGQASGLLPRRELDQFTVLDYKTNHTIDGIPSVVIFSSVLAPGFSETTDRLMQHEESARTYSRFAFALKAGLAFFYILFSLPLTLLAILSGFIFASELVRPIITLEEATRKVSHGDYSVRVKSYSNDELAALINAFNTMLDELEQARVQSAKIEQMTAWGEIAQRMAHEIKNPLTPIKLLAQRISKKAVNHDIDEQMLIDSMRMIVDEADSLTAMVDEFRALSHAQKPYRQQVNLCHALNDAIALFRNAYPKVQFQLLVNEEQQLSFDGKMMHRVFINLIKNSIEAMNEEGIIIISSEKLARNDLPVIRLRFEDTGVGFDQIDLEKIFVPYFSSKLNGSGLGLAVVQKIVFEHQGRIWAEQRPEGGALFIIELPLAD